VIDGHSDAVVDSIGVAKCPVGLCYNTRHDKLYCSSESLISVIDCRADTVLEKIDVRTDLWPSMLYDSVCDRVFCISDDRVIAIDAVRDSIVAETQAKTSLGGLVYDPVHEKLYCSAWNGTDIYIVDCRSMKVRCKAVTGVAAWLARVLPCPHVAYVKYGRGIAIINTDNDCVIGMVELAKTANSSWLPQPNQFAFASRHGRLFVARQRSCVDVFREEVGR
jgi:DNA-binding beta-propeller fold protein YncE